MPTAIHLSSELFQHAADRPAEQICYGSFLGKGGFCEVHLALFRGQVAAMKIASNNEQSAQHFTNEICILSGRLQKLQRIVAPGLMGFGHLVGSNVPWIAMDLVGPTLEMHAEISECQKRSVLHGLQQIHAADVLHCDVAMRNIAHSLYDHNKMIWIDFGNATHCSNDVAKHREYQECVRLLNSL